MNEDLQKKVNRAIRLLKSASKVASKHGQPLEICYSCGKDSEVILELAKMAQIEYRAIYKVTTIDPPGTIKHATERGVEFVRPKESFFQLIRRKGLPSRTVRFCCQELKEYKILDYAVVGIRAEESAKRKELYQEPTQCRIYQNKDEVEQYLPILNWTNQDVADFIEERGIKCHPLYYDENGRFDVTRRLGCMCCPLASKRKRIIEFQKHPIMVRQYIRNASYYFDNHYKNKNRQGQKHFGDVFQWFTMTVFTESMEEFRERFGRNLFDDGIDCKKFLEEYFNVSLDGLH
jgi:phosphoadenosine phosphosulfate reductase